MLRYKIIDQLKKDNGLRPSHLLTFIPGHGYKEILDTLVELEKSGKIVVSSECRRPYGFYGEPTMEDIKTGYSWLLNPENF